jgi:iron(III) transport system ATP-binding protein
MNERPSINPNGGCAIGIEELVVHRGDVVAVDRLSLHVAPGLITAIVGASGCGKTTLLRAIAGFEEPVSGVIRIEDEVVASLEAWVPPERRRVGMVFQEGALFPHLTVRDNVRYGVRKMADGEPRLQEALRLVGLEDLGHRMPHELSGGQQQRVALARALAPSPRVVLLDEPFAGLDATLRERVRDQVRAILERAGVTVVLVTHDQQEALSVAHRVAVMEAGAIRQEGAPEEVYGAPNSPWVAEFIGEGRLVPCTVEAGTFHSAFGSGRCDSPDGSGHLFLRPEDIELLPESAEGGVRATIVGRRFYGHDVLDRVRLESGSEADVRRLSSAAEPVESRVRVVLRGRRFRVFL